MRGLTDVYYATAMAASPSSAIHRREFLLSIAAAGTPLRGAASEAEWTSRWISCPGVSARDYSICHYRYRFPLFSKPRNFPIHVTADNRYQLYVNGVRVVWGPARGLPFHWRYETIDIAPWLKLAMNTLAAVVWYEADLAAVAQVGIRPAFLLEGGRDVNTGRSWKCLRNTAYRPLPVTFEQAPLRPVKC